jgi:hypothetical protein
MSYKGSNGKITVMKSATGISITALFVCMGNKIIGMAYLA